MRNLLPAERWCLALAALPVLLLAFVVPRRLPAPFDLEWLEGGMVLHAERLARGEPLYVPPSVDWTPFLYPPGFPAVVAGIAGLTGEDGLLVGRLVSLLSTLGAALVLAALVRRRGGGWPAALWGGLAFLGTYALSGFWFDLCRVDALAHLLLVAGAALLLGGDPAARLTAWRGLLDVGAGLLVAASLLTKQTGLAAAVALLPAIGGQAWRRALLFTAGLAAGTTLPVLRLRAASDGWFWTYVVTVPSAHPVPWTQAIAACGELARSLPVAAVVLALLPFVPRPLLSRLDPAGATPEARRRLDPWLWPGLATLLSCVWARAHAGSYDNVFLGAHWFAILALARLWDRCLTLPPATDTGRAARTLAAVALGLQALLCLYDPRAVMPARDAAQRHEALRLLLSRAPGEIFFPDRPLLVARAGTGHHAHGMALNDVRRAALAGAPAPDLDALWATRRFAAVIVRPDAITPALEANYVAAPGLTAAVRAAPFPLTGWYTTNLFGMRLRLPDDPPPAGE